MNQDSPSAWAAFPPALLFKKLDESVIEEEYARLAVERGAGIKISDVRELGQNPRLFCPCT